MKKILIVDDNFDDLNSAKKIIDKGGYKTETATNGAQALDLIQNDKPDMVLVDIKMPTLSGYDLLKLLREKLNHKVKLIYFSIVPKNEVDMADADGFIQKPFSPKGLILEIKKAMKKC